MRYSVANKDVCQRSVAGTGECLAKCQGPEFRVGSAGVSNAEWADRCVLMEFQSSGLRSQSADGKAIGCHAHLMLFCTDRISGSGQQHGLERRARDWSQSFCTCVGAEVARRCTAVAVRAVWGLFH